MSQYRSEIRESLISALEDKAAKGNYRKYLKRLTLKKVRGFRDREITFDFPVTALVGPNGGGKTTILGAAALIYKKVQPRRFFAKSGKYDSSMKDWSVEYELIDRDLNRRLPVPRTASFKKAKWNRTAVEREVLIFGVERTVPATERRELVKAAGSKFAAKKEVALTEDVAGHVALILGKSIEGFNRLFVDADGRVTLFSGRTPSGDEYSEFHFGAGEASVIRIIADVEAAPEGAMILIEEIENGLHPVATRRMIEYLIDVAARKALQVIFTTHSNDALAPLPPKAIWAAYNGEVLQGKLDITALRTITGQIDAKLAIFVEDKFAENMVTTALRIHGGMELDAIKVHGMGGASSAIKVNEQHNLDPTSTFPSVCLLDGDQAESVDVDNGVFKLPGTMDPESHVFDRVFERIDQVSAKLAVSMLLPTGQQERVKAVVMSRALTNRDRHLIWEQIGEDLDFTAGYTVASAFLAIWAQEYPEEISEMVEQFQPLLPKR
ncbi:MULTISPECIES: ATP-dependent nuclease [unclassified Streptomyces]|uniref:ATP-dependent nuclease n=1 Tax=unclassified Streptomyces TaxID=2593676 RepID=UPI000B8484B1|nr:MULTISPECIES: AAA family ATPase [unclassified Streptomyces]MYQ54706.1 AAA family ATPase [Streptomyces sp. SID4941]